LDLLLISKIENPDLNIYSDKALDVTWQLLNKDGL
jgi:hypothetical protein